MSWDTFTEFANLKYDGMTGIITMLNILRRTHYFNCTKHEEFLYAVFGLTNSVTTNHCDLAIDYSQTVQEILTGLSRWFVPEKQSLKFLHLVSGPMDTPLNLLSPDFKLIKWFGGMSSWVPDLTIPTDALFSAGEFHSLAHVYHQTQNSLPTGNIIDKIRKLGSLEQYI